jgi:hypothetical protein
VRPDWDNRESKIALVSFGVIMAFYFTSHMIITGIGGGSALPWFKDILRISNNTKQAENIRVLSLGDCNIA